MAATRDEFVFLWDKIRSGEQAVRELKIGSRIYQRQFLSQERLVLLGCGHISQALCKYGVDLGFSVTAVDDRPYFANRSRFSSATTIICDSFPSAIRSIQIRKQDYVSILTRGHRYDADCLRAILSGVFPFYLGMIGSFRRVTGLKRVLVEEGFSSELLERIHTPIGIKINALTVEEIAVSIAAELISCRRQNLNRRSHEAILTDESINGRLIEYLATDSAPKALLTVCETSGSTPVKSGAMMAVDGLMNTVGTIGGGCSEAELLHRALFLIGTGMSQMVTIDMSNSVAEDEGMVCGGEMQVLIEDVITKQS